VTGAPGPLCPEPCYTTAREIAPCAARNGNWPPRRRSRRPAPVLEGRLPHCRCKRLGAAERHRGGVRSRIARILSGRVARIGRVRRHGSARPSTLCALCCLGSLLGRLLSFLLLVQLALLDLVLSRALLKFDTVEPRALKRFEWSDHFCRSISPAGYFVGPAGPAEPQGRYVAVVRSAAWRRTASR
jgi:hypothetical protein